MGQSQSGVISVDDFSNRVMGVAVVLLSSQLDNALTFKSVGQIQPTDTHVLPILTEAPETNPTIEQLISLYSEYSEDKKEYINKYISNHILDKEEHVSQFIAALINGLRKKPVTPPQNYYNKDKPAASLKSVSVAPVKSIGAATQMKSRATERASFVPVASVSATPAAQVAPVSATPVAAVPVKGSNKLQKRMHAVDQAIDAERLVATVHSERSRKTHASVKSQKQDREAEIKNNIDASYSEDGILEAVTSDGTDNDTTDKPQVDSAEEFEHI
jgi:hypothetical protein